MSLLDRIAAQQAPTVERSDPVTMQEFGVLVGQGLGVSVNTNSGVTIGPTRALGLSAWYSGVRYIAETIAGLPCHTYRDTAGTRSQRADPMWMKKPDIETPWYSLIEFMMMSLLHKGNSYNFKIRNPAGQVVGLRKIHPDRVKPGQASDGTKVFQLDGREDLTFTGREILHIPGLSYDGIVGLNPIQYGAETLGVVAAANESAARSFGAGSGIDAFLSIPETLTTDEANKLKAVWEQQHRGLINAHELAILGGGAEYKTIGLNPEDAQLLESRQFGVTEVARLLRLPPHKLYDLTHATYSNIEHQEIAATTDGIRPPVQRIEAWFEFDPDLMPPENFIEFDLKGLTRGDLKSEYEAYGAGIAGGFIMPAEPRERLNLPYVEGSKVLFQPMNQNTVGPDATEAVADTRDLTAVEAVQKVYLGVVNKVISAEEGRQMINDLGGNLTGPPPKEAPGASTP